MGGGSERPSVNDRRGSDSEDGESWCWTRSVLEEDGVDGDCWQFRVELVMGRWLERETARRQIGRSIALHLGEARRANRLVPALRNVAGFMVDLAEMAALKSRPGFKSRNKHLVRARISTPRAMDQKRRPCCSPKISHQSQDREMSII